MRNAGANGRRAVTSLGSGPAILDAHPRDRGQLLDHFNWVRGETERLAEPLSAEDQVVQSMPDASPTKWHRAHVTWFFETMILREFAPDYVPLDEHYCFLFNSYYDAVGARHPRPERGLLTRPSAEEVKAYRDHVDAAMQTLIADADADTWSQVAPLIVLGLHHEQQHQELLLMDILHAFSHNSVAPAYQAYRSSAARKTPELRWFDHDGGLVEIGHDGSEFAFDNEGPRHQVHLAPFRLASRLVTNGEWKDFMADGGYHRPELWLSDGWAAVGEHGWAAPLYWQEIDGEWHAMSLSGLQQVNDQAPVCHVSLYEADAYARWAGKRLPREGEWEVFAREQPVAGNFVGSGLLRTAPATDEAPDRPEQMFGDVWEWTQSPYVPYPGFKAVTGAVGEYNGKFMANQFVLRGGACVTPEGHTRATYRNFFYPAMRWIFAGVRLADDGAGETH
jgi:ergothioneine biosynthesis protein EgtB